MSRAPVFSIPSQSVESRINAVTPKINSELLKGKTDFEKMVLQQNDMTLQHGEIIARAVDEQNKSLDLIQSQVVETNGKVKDHEIRIQKSEEYIKNMKAGAKARTTLTITLVPIFAIFLEVVAKHFGWL